MAILEATNLYKSYSTKGSNPTEVLRGANLRIEDGEFVAIVGPSGAGKSTLLHLLASLDLPTDGSVVLTVEDSSFDFAHSTAEKLAELRNRYIGMVFQFHHLLPEFTALENVMMPALIAGIKKSDATRTAKDLLRKVGMEHRAMHMPSELSGGEQQRVAIARALTNNPKILLADEPTGNLDSANADSVVELLVEMQQSFGITCVVATHSSQLASKAHRVVTMHDGICSEQR